MKDYRPQLPFSTPLNLFIPAYETVKGVSVKTYPSIGIRFFGSFKTYGGTESVVNGVYSLINTANIETWYRPDIDRDCKIENALTGEMYEVVGKPENINMRNQFLKLKVRSVGGGG